MMRLGRGAGAVVLLALLVVACGRRAPTYEYLPTETYTATGADPTLRRVAPVEAPPPAPPAEPAASTDSVAAPPPDPVPAARGATWPSPAPADPAAAAATAPATTAPATTAPATTAPATTAPAEPVHDDGAPPPTDDPPVGQRPWYGAQPW